MKLILAVLMLFVMSITAACNGGPTSGTHGSNGAPAGLSYSDPAVVYAVGSAIPSNVPSSSGGAITQYSVSPALPAGL
ncbi:kelch-like protein, partial [Burkholderia dolosa]|nr:kelch-like protein [Burkholderia dolosa]